MKYLIFFTLFIFIITPNLFAQSEYASVSPISAQSSYNDFADIDVTVTASAGYEWFFTAVEYVDWQSGSNWINVVDKEYDSAYPYDGLPHTWSITNESIQITDIAQKGNGTFKYKFSVDVNSASDNEYVTFSVTDVVAPAAPQNLTISTSSNDHPLLQWSANTEVDLNRYRVYRLNGDPDIFYVSGTSFEDEDVEVSQSGTTINYYVKAEDQTGNLSNASNQASIHGYLGKRFSSNPVEKNFPNSFSLAQNYPNPFNPGTYIKFALPQREFVSLTVYNLKGQKITTLVNEYKEAGVYSIAFNGQNLPSGIYYYTMKAGSFSEVKRMLLVK